MEQVILVDEQDNEIGAMEKMEVHKKGLLHRAISVLIFNSKGELLLQQRADGKYHSAGLWTNTCCSHPRPGESTEAAAHRRLKEEMGIETQLNPAFSFTYRSNLENGLVEYEFDHVYTGVFNGDPAPDSREVRDWKFVPLQWVREDLRANKKFYTVWFDLLLNHNSLSDFN